MLRNHASSNIGSAGPFVNVFVMAISLAVLAGAYFSTLGVAIQSIL